MEGGGAGDYGDPQHPPDMEAALEAPPAPQRGTGRKRGRPKGSGRGRASKGASPSHSPKPVTNQLSARLSNDCFCFSLFLFLTLSPFFVVVLNAVSLLFLPDSGKFSTFIIVYNCRYE